MLTQQCLPGEAGCGVPVSCSAAFLQCHTNLVLERQAFKITPCHPHPLTSFVTAVQINWQLGSAVFGLLLRRYAPHDTYTVSSRLCLSLALCPAAWLTFLLSRDPFIPSSKEHVHSAVWANQLVHQMRSACPSCKQGVWLTVLDMCAQRLTARTRRVLLAIQLAEMMIRCHGTSGPVH